MLDPNEIIKLSERSEIVAAELQEEIVKDICERIALRLGRGDDYILTARDKWRLEVLKDAGYLVDDLIKIIAKKTGVTVKEMRKAFAEAGVSSTKFDDLTYERAGLPVIPIQQSPAMIRLLERGMNKTFSEWKNYTGTTVRAAYDLYVKECDRAYNNVLSGHMTYGEAVKVALNHASADGGEVIYPSGHRDTLETATYRAVRTGISQACSDVTSVRAAENGITLFITSSHLGARPTHEPWQGKVFWVDWDLLSTALGITYENPNTASISEKAKYDEFVKTTEIGTVTGLCGANCRHSYGPYIEGISHNPYTQFDSEENRKRYEAEQTQRSFERKIRKQRRKVEGLKAGLKEMDPGVAKETRDQLKKEQAKLNDLQRQYKEYSEGQGLKVQTNRLEVTPIQQNISGYNDRISDAGLVLLDDEVSQIRDYSGNNCSNDFVAREYRERGELNVYPAPRNEDSEIRKYPWRAFKGASPLKLQTQDAFKELSQKLEEYGNNARLQVLVPYDNTNPAVLELGYEPADHTIMAKNNNGLIQFIETSIGASGAESIFEVAKMENVRYFRVDDKPFTELAEKCIERR
jgi:hypothetical protein